MGLIYSWIKQENNKTNIDSIIMLGRKDKGLNLMTRLFQKTKVGDLVDIIADYYYEDYKKIFSEQVVPILNKGMIRNCESKRCTTRMKLTVHQLRQYEIVDEHCPEHAPCGFIARRTCCWHCYLSK